MPLNADATFAKTYLKDPFRLSPAATGSSSLRDDYAQALFVLMAIAGLVLLVTYGNIASLLLARRREPEKLQCVSPSAPHAPG